MPGILTSCEDGVCTLRISNEAKRNAITHAMAGQLLQYFQEVNADPGIRVVVIVGEGDKAFSSGHDLGEPIADSDDLHDRPFLYPERMQIPVIAAISGHCHGAGLILALSCDIRVSDRGAKFGSPGARLGMLPEGGQICRLAKIMSPGRAKLFMMTARIVHGQRAYEWGLVDELAADGTVLETALDLAREIARNAPASVQEIKTGMRLMDEEHPAEWNEWERTTAARLMSGPDAREGLAAFTEKRAPSFTSRVPKGCSQ